MAITIIDNIYKINGKLINSGGENVSGFEIKALDKDLLNDDFLGSSFTSENGSFQITFAEKAFKEIFDKRPDLYFEIYHGKTKVLTTKAMTFANVEANDLPLHLTINFQDTVRKEAPKTTTPIKENEDFALVETNDNTGEDVVLGGGNGTVPATSHKLNSSTELMNNYKQIEIIDQRKKFQVAQTDNGHALFFSIGTDEKFYLIKEQSATKTGWEKIELSSTLLEDGKTIKTFDIAQNHDTGEINIALAISNSNRPDQLFISQNNSASNLNSANPITWTEIADDRLNQEGSQLIIVDLYVAEVGNNTDIFVVDIEGDNDAIARFWINTVGDSKWNSHSLPANFSNESTISCQIGRAPVGGAVNGIYNFGASKGENLQLIYQLLFDEFDPEIAPPSIVFNLTATTLNDSNAAFSVCKSASGNKDETDLFLAGGGNLYYYAANNQIQNAEPLLVITNKLFNTVKNLHASISESRAVIWGQNENDQVFYTSCSLSEINNSDSWSLPIIILSGVSGIQPYIDRSNDGITFFANIGEGRITKGYQDKGSTMWKFTTIELPTPDENTKPEKALSYTTTVQVTDQNNIPVPGAEVTITAQFRTKVYINHLYYTLDTKPITVKADANGVVTIIEWVDHFQGTNFQFHHLDTANEIVVNPTHHSLQKLLSLNSESALNSAVIKQKDGTTKPLMRTSVTSEQKQKLAAVIQNLNTVSNKVQSGNTTVKSSSPSFNSASASVVEPSEGISYIEASAGSLLQLLEGEIEFAVELIEDTASDVWHFVVTIGEEVIGFIVDTVEKIAGALKVVWEKIAGFFEDVVEYLSFVFDVDDILATKDVMKQVIKIYFHKVAEEIQVARHLFDDMVVNVEETISEWAKIPDSARPTSAKMNRALKPTAEEQKDSPQHNTAPGSFLMGHFQANIKRSTITTPPSNLTEDLSWSGLTDLTDFTNNEQAIIQDLINEVAILVSDPRGLSNPDLGDILKRIVGDIALAGLELLKVAVDKILDFLTLVIEDIVDSLDTPISIPVLSDIIEEEFKFKLPSILDIICLIGAVPATAAYKVLNDSAPFTKESGSLFDKITNANTFTELSTAFGITNQNAIDISEISSLSDVADLIPLSKEDRSAIFQACHYQAGILTFFRALIEGINEETDGGASTALGTPLTVISITRAVTLFASDLFVMPAPIKNASVNAFSSGLSKVNMLQKLVFGSGAASKAVSKIKGISETGALNELNAGLRIVSEGIGAMFSLVGLIIPCYHIYELAEAGLNTKDEDLALFDAVSDITDKFSNIVGFAALVDEEEVSKQVLVISQVGLSGITGIYQLIDGVIDAKV